MILPILAVLAILAAMTLSLVWSRTFESTATILKKEHLPARLNSLAEYDAYMLQDDSRLFSYFPEKFRLHLGHDGKKQVVDVSRNIYDRVSEGEKIGVHYRQLVVFRSVSVIKITPRDAQLNA